MLAGRMLEIIGCGHPGGLPGSSRGPCGRLQGLVTARTMPAHGGCTDKTSPILPIPFFI